MVDFLLVGRDATSGSGKPRKYRAGDVVVDDGGLPLTIFGGAYYMGRYSASVPLSGASNNWVFAAANPVVISNKITHNVVTGAFTVTDAGIYFISVPACNGGTNDHQVSVNSPALISPNPAVPSNFIFSHSLQVNGFGTEQQSSSAMISLGAGGTFDIRHLFGSVAANHTFIQVMRIA